MACIIVFDTSTKACSVSLYRDSELLASWHRVSEGYTHAEELHLRISEVMQKAQVKFSQLDAVAVGKGPGSYTGLRIGVSSAKGLAYGLDIPLISIESLDLIIAGIETTNESILIPMIDARRLEAYAKVIARKEKEYFELESTTNIILDSEDFKALLERYIDHSIYFLGDAAVKTRDFLISHAGINQFTFYPDNYPDTRFIGALLENLFKQKRFENVITFEPFYLKDFMLTPKRG
ncbi:MAG: tRNA (adenosine(37)-N6)-threonylcarbamoyltransferase complex dimerization subunit type 1 TsaB [Flavobacteriaceae bacterium]